MHRPKPGDDLPDLVVGLDDLAERRHRSHHVLGSLADEALLGEGVAGAEAAGAERDHAEQCVVVIAIDPDDVGQGRRHSAATAASVAAIAVMREIDLVTFLGDGRYIRVGALQLTPWGGDGTLKGGHCFLGRCGTQAGQRSYGQTDENPADLQHVALARCFELSLYVATRRNSRKCPSGLDPEGAYDCEVMCGHPD